MAGGWSRRLAGRARALRVLLRDTQRALADVADMLRLDPELSTAVQEVATLSARPTVLVLLGTSSQARARLLHCLLGRQLLPDEMPRGCRWIRVQYGITTQVHLTLGNSEFELVEELVCNKSTWETLPVEDMIRRDQTDLATVLEVELNHPFLKDGLRIMIPPDLDLDPGTRTLHQLKQIHADFYTKRESILKGYNPVYLFALDKIGQNVFSENCVPNFIGKSRSEEDFWSTYNLYYMTRSSENSVEKGGGTRDVDKKVPWMKRGDVAVITPENCLDLYQAKELNPHAQVLFVLFANSDDVTATNDVTKREAARASVDATESTEDFEYTVEELPESDQELVQSAMSVAERSSLWRPPPDVRLSEAQASFMNELLDQWEIMSCPPPKHYAKSQSLIIDDKEILRTADPTLASFLSSAIQNAIERDKSKKYEEIEGDTVKSRTALLNTVVQFTTDCFQGYLLECCLKLSEVHVKLLQHFILASFDMARELQIVPKKIQYVARQEQQLYETINEKFTEGEKKQELLNIMEEVLKEIRLEVNNMDWSVDDLPWHQDHQFVVSNSTFYSSRELPTSSTTADDSSASDGEEAMSYDSHNFDDYDIIDSSSCSVSGSFVNVGKCTAWWAASQAASIRVETECEASLCAASCGASPGACGASPGACGASPGACGASLWSSGRGSCAGPSLSLKQATLDVQQTVLSNLSRKISQKLVKFVDCLKDSYFGTLQRCVEALELRCGSAERPPVSAAVKQLAAAAAAVRLAPAAPASALRALLQALRTLLRRLRLPGGSPEPECCALSPRWRRRVALRTVHSLTPTRLARLISNQILEKLSVAHERFQAALTSLESVLNNRLHQTEDVKLAIRKKYAPSFARLCLESTSMCDVLMYGTPKLGREIGRGQYGVVYSAKGEWGGHSPLAVKSVLPADERHYQELAMEFFYTRSIPRHPRIVPLLGSVVQRHGSGGGPCVLLISERRTRDLHAAIRAGLSFSARMRVSCDIVEGIRYLHSFGLVHRDVKMKNVLLDADGRAALADLGFCAAGGLLSGSLVGTPVHMAPELLTPPYDATVDVYAFGVLFWYVCAGNIKLPSAFEMFQNKEQLWSKVKRGLRPERLDHFSDECWEIMESCWASEPSQRACLGDIQPKLEKILEDALKTENTYNEPYTQNEVYDVSDDDSLNMTGVEWNGV